MGTVGTRRLAPFSPPPLPLRPSRLEAGTPAVCEIFWPPGDNHDESLWFKQDSQQTDYDYDYEEVQNPNIQPVPIRIIRIMPPGSAATSTVPACSY